MRSLLYLVHRLPYPPNKGDKITSFNMLKYLSQHFNVYLATFVDDENDWQYVETVKQYCTETCIVKLNPKMAKLKSLSGFLSNEALSLPYYRNAEMQTWVDDTLEQQTIDSVLIFSGVMAQFVTKKLPESVNSVFDMEDVDSDKWNQYANEHTWPMNWIYRREAKKLLCFEAKMTHEFDYTVLVSEKEVKLYNELVPGVEKKVVFRTQGLDSNFFDPTLEYENFYQDDDKVFVFVGAMDYLPNVDGAVWFGATIFPKVHKQYPQAKFYIVGMNPSEEVKQLEAIDGITVTGSVDDVRPYVAHAFATITPLRIARGIQNKVLEAMAMKKTVIATPNALQGLKTCPGFQPMVADDEASLYDAVIQSLESPSFDHAAGRECILKNYNWDTNLKEIEELLS